MKEFLCRIVLLVLLEGGTITTLFAVGKMDADWNLKMSRKGAVLLKVLCVLQSADIARRREWSHTIMCFWGILAGCLLTACVMDLWEKQIYRYVWWAAGGAVFVLFGSGTEMAKPSGKSIGALAVFVLLQYGLFGRLYGRADCSAFSVCAAALTFLGKGFSDYVFHMALAFCVLALVQIFKGNIAGDGNLRKPVALVPYITAAFWFWVDFMG